MDELTIALDKHCQGLQRRLDAEISTSRIFEEAARSLQGKCDVLQQTLSTIYRRSEEPQAPMYSVFLLDADAVHFSDHALKGLGGSRTALDILEILREVRSGIVRVRVYGNVAWLSDVYLDGRVVQSADVFKTFVRDFNAASPWVEFTAVGSEQDASRQKVQDILRVHLQDESCEYIVYGGEVNDRVQDALREYKRLDQPERVLFLDTSANGGPPADPEVVSDGSGKDFVIMENIFRHAPLARSTATAHPVQTLSFDNLGRRMDPRVAPSQKMIDHVAGQMFCNNLYLKGKCVYPRCKHNHTAKLRREEMEALVFLGRSITCRNGRGCKDLDCYAGHICPRSSCDGECGFGWEEHLPGVLMDDEARGERRKIKLGGEWHHVSKGGR